MRNGAWRFSAYQADFFSPGMKILNFHPFAVAVNAPDAEFYLSHKRHIQSLSATEASLVRHPGRGASSFLIEAIGAILQAGGRFVTLSEMANRACRRTLAA